MTSQRRDGADGSQIDRGRETVVETDIESAARSHPSKLRDSSTMSGAGKTVSGVKKTKSRISEGLMEGQTTQITLLSRKRSPTLGCRGH